jgi:hypothetical protein
MQSGSKGDKGSFYSGPSSDQENIEVSGTPLHYMQNGYEGATQSM